MFEIHELMNYIKNALNQCKRVLEKKICSNIYIFHMNSSKYSKIGIFYLLENQRHKRQQISIIYFRFFVSVQVERT